jgi:hypothetical protein
MDEMVDFERVGGRVVDASDRSIGDVGHVVHVVVSGSTQSTSHFHAIVCFGLVE